MLAGEHIFERAYREDINHIYAAHKRACRVVAGKVDLKISVDFCIKVLQLLHMRMPMHQLSLPKLQSHRQAALRLCIGLKPMTVGQDCEWC